MPHLIRTAKGEKDQFQFSSGWELHFFRRHNFLDFLYNLIYINRAKKIKNLPQLKKSHYNLFFDILFCGIEILTKFFVSVLGVSSKFRFNHRELVLMRVLYQLILKIKTVSCMKAVNLKLNVLSFLFSFKLFKSSIESGFAGNNIIILSPHLRTY